MSILPYAYRKNDPMQIPSIPPKKERMQSLKGVTRQRPPGHPVAKVLCCWFWHLGEVVRGEKDVLVVGLFGLLAEQLDRPDQSERLWHPQQPRHLVRYGKHADAQNLRGGGRTEVLPKYGQDGGNRGQPDVPGLLAKKHRHENGTYIHRLRSRQAENSANQWAQPTRLRTETRRDGYRGISTHRTIIE